MTLKQQPIPLALYIHIPWCVQKCPYCDFNSHESASKAHSHDAESSYVDALLADLKHDLPRVQDREINSIFIGGGTPSLFSGAAIAKLLEGVRNELVLTSTCEITLEANPGTVEASRFQAYFEAGVNRLSMGIQSFNDAHLKKLGRIHDAAQALEAIAIAKSSGFREINLDIMHGLPNQSIEQALADLTLATAQQTTHLSWYQLTLEPNTAFYQHPPPLPNDELIADMQAQGKALLAQTGFNQYEISAYSQTGSACRHNLNYWQYGDYLGIGAGAHAKLTDAKAGKINRLVKYRHPKDYLNTDKPFIQQAKTVAKSDIALEYMLGAMRLAQPILLAQFQQRTGLTLADIRAPLDAGVARNLLTYNEEQITLTPLGMRFANDTMSLFMNDYLTVPAQ